MINHWGGGMSVATALAMVFVLVAAIAGIMLLVRYFTRSSDQTPFQWVEPETILRERFALGQIDEAAFQTKLAHLRAGK